MMCEVCNQNEATIETDYAPEEIWIDDVMWVVGLWVCADCEREYADIRMGDVGEEAT